MLIVSFETVIPGFTVQLENDLDSFYVLISSPDRIAVVERQVDETLTEMVDEEKKNFDELLKVGSLTSGSTCPR